MMAKIKRIVTSDVEGRTLSDRYDDNSYIYNGEGLIQHYGDNSVMHAVLRPGTFYGADGDSSDGFGNNTIKLIPNYEGGDDRYLIIDPTAPNHIHIRAGGIQDASNADLILGAEETSVIVSDNADAVILKGTGGQYLNYISPETQIATVQSVQGVTPTPVSWQPLLSGSGFVQSSNPATGSYMHFGKLAVVNLSIPFSAVTNFGTGQYQINLPVAAAKHTDLWAGTLHNTSSSDFYSIKGHVDAESSTMTLWAIASTLKDEPFKYNYPIVLDTTDLFHMSFIYETV
jgi:hypothetical protein